MTNKAMSKRSLKFNKGDRVIYVPKHANGNRNHKDCEHGIVYSLTEEFVFVKYDNAECKMLTGDEPYTPRATKKDDLVSE